jgi:hypothetical protein
MIIGMLIQRESNHILCKIGLLLDEIDSGSCSNGATLFCRQVRRISHGGRRCSKNYLSHLLGTGSIIATGVRLRDQLEMHVALGYKRRRGSSCRGPIQLIRW